MRRNTTETPNLEATEILQLNTIATKKNIYHQELGKRESKELERKKENK